MLPQSPRSAVCITGTLAPPESGLLRSEARRRPRGSSISNHSRPDRRAVLGRAKFRRTWNPLKNYAAMARSSSKNEADGVFEKDKGHGDHKLLACRQITGQGRCTKIAGPPHLNLLVATLHMPLSMCQGSLNQYRRRRRVLRRDLVEDPQAQREGDLVRFAGGWIAAKEYHVSVWRDRCRPAASPA